MKIRLLPLLLLCLLGLGMLAAPMLARVEGMPVGDSPVLAWPWPPQLRLLPPLPPSTLNAVRSANSTRPVETIELPLLQDAFIAGQYPFDNERFGQEEFLAVGAYNNLGELIILLDYAWEGNTADTEIVEAVLFYGVGDGSDLDMPVGVAVAPVFEESTVTWGSSRSSIPTPTSTGVLGKVGYWYGIDVTAAVRQHPKDGHIRLAIRSNMLAHNFYKGSASREFDPELAPHLVVNHTRLDNIPPRVWFDPVPPEWMNNTANKFYINGIDAPNPGTAISYHVEARRNDGAWEDYRGYPLYGPGRTEVNVFYFSPQYGDRLEFRVKARDNRGNVSEWVNSGESKYYSEDMTGWLTDHRGRDLPPTDPHLQPIPWWTVLDTVHRTFTSRLGDPWALTGQPEVSGYGSWGRQKASSMRPMILVIPPLDNVMAEVGQAERLDQWEVVAGTGVIVLQPDAFAGAGLRVSGGDTRFCTRSFYDISDLNQPTLGFSSSSDQYYTTVLEVGWETDRGDYSQLGVVDRISQYDGAWPYAWLDLIAHRTERGRPCFTIVQTIYNDHPRILLDAISIGSTRSDLRVAVQHPMIDLPPAEAYPLVMVVTNTSPHIATARLKVQTDGAAEPLVWLLPVLQPGEVFTQTTMLTVPPTGAALPFTVTVGKTAIDDTPADNVYHWAILPAPAYSLFLPRMRY